MTAPQPVFRALADPTRREILRLLAARPMSVVELAGEFAMTRAAVKKHLTVLQAGGLLTMAPVGRSLVSTLEPDGFQPVFSWLEYFDQFWDDRLHALKSAIEKEQNDD